MTRSLLNSLSHICQSERRSCVRKVTGKSSSKKEGLRQIDQEVSNSSSWLILLRFSKDSKFESISMYILVTDVLLIIRARIVDHDLIRKQQQNPKSKRKMSSCCLVPDLFNLCCIIIILNDQNVAKGRVKV